MIAECVLCDVEGFFGFCLHCRALLGEVDESALGGEVFRSWNFEKLDEHIATDTNASTLKTLPRLLKMAECNTPYCSHRLGPNDQAGYCTPCTVAWYQQQQQQQYSAVGMGMGMGMGTGMAPVQTNAYASAAPTDTADDVLQRDLIRQRQAHAQGLERMELRARLEREALAPRSTPVQTAPPPPPPPQQQQQQPQPRQQASHGPAASRNGVGASRHAPGAGNKLSCGYCVRLGRATFQTRHAEAACGLKKRAEVEKKKKEEAKKEDEKIEKEVEEVDDAVKQKKKNDKRKEKAEKLAKREQKVEAGEPEKVEMGEQQRLPEVAEMEPATANEARALLIECLQQCIRAYPDDSLEECLQRIKAEFGQENIRASLGQPGALFERIRGGQDGGAILMMDELRAFAKELEEKK